MTPLQLLRAKLNAPSTPRHSFPWTKLPEGMPRGALVEIAGSGKTELTASFLAENPEIPAAWIEANFSVFPMALRQRNILLEKLFFVEGKKECAWAASTILRSQLFPLLIYHAPLGEDRELRRFQLLSEKASSTMILLCEKKASLAWPISLSLEIQKQNLKILRRK